MAVKRQRTTGGVSGERGCQMSEKEGPTERGGALPPPIGSVNRIF